MLRNCVRDLYNSETCNNNYNCNNNNNNNNNNDLSTVFLRGSSTSVILKTNNLHNA